MPGPNGDTGFAVDKIPSGFAYTGHDVGHLSPYATQPEDSRATDRNPSTKMNWAELSEGAGDHLMPGPLDFRTGSIWGQTKPNGQPRGMGMQKFAPAPGAQMHRLGGADRREMERGMPDSKSVHNKMKPSGFSGTGQHNSLSGIEGMMYPGAEVMAGTGEAPMYGQPRDFWDTPGAMSNRVKGRQGDSGMAGGRGAGDRRRGAWGADASGMDMGGAASRRNGNMSGDARVNGNGSGRPSPWNPGAADTMKAQLQALQLEDPTTVFIARRINKLGFTSAEQLEAHFSKYGEVKGVYVSHSRVKSLRAPGDRNMHDAHWRLRAAALGFVVMKSPEATTQILAEGSEHNVNGVTVRLQSFHRRNCADAAGEESSPTQENKGSVQEPSSWPAPGGDDSVGSAPVRSQPSPANTKAAEDPEMMDGDELYNNFVISGGPIIYTSAQ